MDDAGLGAVDRLGHRIVIVTLSLETPCVVCTTTGRSSPGVLGAMTVISVSLTTWKLAGGARLAADEHARHQRGVEAAAGDLEGLPRVDAVRADRGHHRRLQGEDVAERRGHGRGEDDQSRPAVRGAIVDRRVAHGRELDARLPRGVGGERDLPDPLVEEGERRARGLGRGLHGVTELGDAGGEIHRH